MEVHPVLVKLRVFTRSMQAVRQVPFCTLLNPEGVFVNPSSGGKLEQH